MKRKGWIILLTFITFLAVGGSLYKDHEKKVEEKNGIAQIKAEYNSVVELKKTFTGIKSIKFNEASPNWMIEGNNMTVTITYEIPPDSPPDVLPDIYTFSFLYFTKNKVIGELGINFYIRETEGVTKGKVEVTYTNGEKTSI
ncbi:hypothetical protein [Dellaglioa algida]|uniref:Uncharacterized protein n=1 Tax=Dellaglioa algida TaxID=105612 RepID=A0A5C6M821_9LACO|nr:hypothetical protein [Dellaglioa algida]MDK1717493.1 hypothetical protein [Dellaglioa algida]MDK1720766.1 hypothetical protein [Dellaglioa algida]MDK1722435.1 hypothetical protein [Dellaglioa algida]MDK1724059.1 hypothetical protein [Dellaglioa algida]MDK1725640.1 hypothetical protein [Dellaglioa algida]